MRITQIALYDKDAEMIDKLAANSDAPWNSIDGGDADQISKILFGIGCQGTPAQAGAIEAGDFRRRPPKDEIGLALHSLEGLGPQLTQRAFNLTVNKTGTITSGARSS